MANKKCYNFTFTWPVAIKLDIRMVYEKSYVTNEVCYIFTSTNITNNNKLKRIKIALKSIILLKFVFSDIINGYCKKFMAINAMTDLEDYLFF